jgi:hypothetical protein
MDAGEQSSFAPRRLAREPHAQDRPFALELLQQRLQ